MLVVGLTGGIASGKTTVARLFENWGAKVIDADEIGHYLILPGKKAWRQLVEEFGEEILLPQGLIDRDHLGHIIFGDLQARKRLNEIIHPLLVAELKRRVDELRASRFDGIVVIDAALLPEWDLSSLVQKIIVVRTKKELQIQRLVKFKGLSPQEAQRRVEAQAQLEEKILEAEYTIVNDQNLTYLKKEAERVWKELVQEK